MSPTNNIFFGGTNDPLSNINSEIARLEVLRKQMESSIGGGSVSQQQNSIWVAIDKEVGMLTQDQKDKLIRDEKYIDVNNKVQEMIQAELINLVMPHIEALEQGRNILNNMLEVVRSTKNRIIKETNLEMELFSKFREFSKQNPNVTYEEFIKTIH